MRDLLRQNENADAAFHLFLSFVVLYLIAGFVHPYLLGIGSVEDEQAQDAKSKHKRGTKASQKTTRPDK